MASSWWAGVLEADGLAKTYAPPRGILRPLVKSATRTSVTAFTDVSFAARAGSVLGVVGANGAGKSTLVRIFATLLLPTAGTCRVDGVDVVARAGEVRRLIGAWLSDQRGMYWRLSGRQNLEMFGELAGLRRGIARARAAQLLAEVGLSDAAETLVFGYSNGMRARLGIAIALVGDPPVLLLDEPANGLDPLAVADLLDRVRGLAAAGRTVLFASNRMEEILAVADTLIVLAGGRVAALWHRDELASAARDAGRAEDEMLAAALRGSP